MGFQNNVRVDVRGAAHIVPCTYKTVVLKQNVTKQNINVLTQNMLDEYGKNTKFVIKWDYVLDENITVPVNCILEFDGGSVLNNGYTISGTIKNDTIYSYWFKDDTSFVSFLNNVDGYNKVEFENKTFNINEPISVNHNCLLNGNGAIIKRGDVVNENSKQVIDIDNFDNIVIKNIIFDGSLTSSIESPTATEDANGAVIKNGNNLRLENVTFRNFNIKPFAIDDGYDDFVSFFIISNVYNVVIDSCTFIDVYCQSELISIVPLPSEIVSGGDYKKFFTTVRNSLFDCYCWSPLNCFGKLYFQNNQIDKRSKGGSIINNFGSNSIIEYNIIKNAGNSIAFDFSEGGKEYCYPEHIIVKANKITNSNCGLVLAICGNDITIQDNYLEWVPVSGFSNAERVFELPNCYDVLIDNNKIFGVKRIFSNDYEPVHYSGNAPLLHNITITNNLFQSDITNTYIQLYNSFDNIVIENNVFNLTASSVGNKLVWLRPKDNTVVFDNLRFSKNIINNFNASILINTDDEISSIIKTIIFTENISTYQGKCILYKYGNNNHSYIENNYNISCEEYIRENVLIDNITNIFKHTIYIGEGKSLSFSEFSELVVDANTIIRGGSLIGNKTNIIGTPKEISSNLEGTWQNYRTSSFTPSYKIDGQTYLYKNRTQIVVGMDGAWKDVFGRTPNIHQGKSFPTGLDNGADRGFDYYHYQLNKQAFWNGSYWITPDGYSVCPKYGSSRPTTIIEDDTNGYLHINDIGFRFFDTTINKPIYVSAINNTTGVITWVDATGATV